MTSDNAAGKSDLEVIAKFDCPRCGRVANSERFYGPCSACRDELRSGAPFERRSELAEAPGAVIAAPRRSEGPWIVLGAGVGPIRHAGELVERFGAGVDQIWLTRPALEELGLPLELAPLRRRSPAPFLELARAEGWCGAGPAVLQPWLALWLEESPHRAAIVAPAWDASSPFHRVDDADELAEALCRYLELVGVPWTYTGGVTSDNLARARHRGARGISRGAIPAPMFHARRGHHELEFDFSFARSALELELAAPYAHAFDVNGAYLSATSSLALPAGEPIHHAGPLEISSKAPGLWLVSPPSAGAWPDPFRPIPSSEHDPAVWVTTPIAALAGELGLEAHEAWIWPEHHRYLEGWNRTLRDARSALLASSSSVDALALAAVKATYKSGIGRLAFTKRARESDRDLEQPVWRELVVATARARLYRNLRKAPRPPFAISFDCVWYFSEHAAPEQCAAELGLELSDQLGKFKVAHTVAGDRAREALDAGDAWRVHKALREACS